MIASAPTQPATSPKLARLSSKGRAARSAGTTSALSASTPRAKPRSRPVMLRLRGLRSRWRLAALPDVRDLADHVVHAAPEAEHAASDHTDRRTSEPLVEPVSEVGEQREDRAERQPERGTLCQVETLLLPGHWSSPAAVSPCPGGAAKMRISDPGTEKGDSLRTPLGGSRASPREPGSPRSCHAADAPRLSSAPEPARAWAAATKP